MASYNVEIPLRERATSVSWLTSLSAYSIAIHRLGDIVFKPRGHWHTFWNAGDGQLRVLEVIAPGGLEELFRRLAEPGGEYDPATLPTLAAEYGCEVDFDRTMPLVERHGLVF